MNEYLESILVALVQGVTEFLPISSSGHIILAQALLEQDLDLGMTFNIITHFGTLGSIVIYFYSDLMKLLASAWQMLLNPTEIREYWEADEAARFNIFVLVSMIPAAVVGFTIREPLEAAFANPLGVSLMLVLTGFLLIATWFFGQGVKHLNLRNTFLIGLAQALALIPGISRSGTTMAAGIFLGINRKYISRFTFIMMLPVVAGAVLVEIISIGFGDVDASYLPHLILGFVVSLISGYFALKYLIILFESRGIHYFAWYCWLIGFAGLYYFSQ